MTEQTVSRTSSLRRLFFPLLCVAACCLFAQAAFAQNGQMTIIAGNTAQAVGCTPTTFSGPICNGSGGASVNGIPATSAKLQFPVGAVFDQKSGFVYIADSIAGEIRYIDLNANIQHYAYVNGAGSGTTATAVTTDAAGNVYFGDDVGNVYLPNGTVVPHFGQSVEALAPDSRGNLYILTSMADGGAPPYQLYVYNVTSNTGALIAATGTTAGLSGQNDVLYGIAVDSSGNVYSIDKNYAVNGAPGEVILEFAMSSTGGGLPTATSIVQIVEFATQFAVYGQSLAIDRVGNFYLNEGSAIIEYSPGPNNNVAPAVAGTGKSGYSVTFALAGGVPIPATSSQAEINQVQGISVTPEGVLYIADTDNNLVRTVSSSTGCQECGPTTVALTDQLPVNSFGFAVNPVTQELYVPIRSANVVNVYDSTKDLLIASIPVGPSPGQVVVDSVNNLIYVPDIGSTGSVMVNNVSVPTYEVTVINGKTKTVNAEVTLPPQTPGPFGAIAGGQPLTIAVDPTLNKAYVAIYNGSSVVVVNGPSSSNGNVATLGATIPNVFIPAALAVDTVNNRVYARCFCVPNNPNLPLGEEEYSMDIIDATTDTVTSTQILFQAPSTDIATDSIAVDENSGRVVIADTEFETLHIWVPATAANPGLIGYFLNYSPNLYPEHVVVDSNNEIAYFTDGYGNSASLNLTTFQAFSLSQAPVVENTCGAAANVLGVDPSTDQAYMTTCPVTQGATTSVLLSLIDGPTGKILYTLLLPTNGGNPSSVAGSFAIAVSQNPLTHAVYVENSLSNTINVINGPTTLYSRPVLSFSLAPFAPVAAGATAMTTLTVTNSGTVTSNGSAVTTLTPTIAVNQGQGTPTITPLTCPVPPATLAGGGAQCTYTVTFSPGALTPTETFGGSIVFTDTALDTPQTVNFSGTIGVTSVSFSPSQLAFGSVPWETNSGAATITVTNEGSAPLVFSQIALIQSGSTSYVSDYEITSNDCTGASGIAAGLTCTIAVTYLPFNFPPGTQEPVLLEFTDNAGSSPQTIIVTGTSAAQALGYGNVETSVNFGNIEVNQPSVTKQIVMENDGGAALTINSITSSNPADFPVLSTTCPIGAATPLALFGTCTINVSFTPSSTPITQETAQIVISESNSSVSSQTISLTGVSSLAPASPPAVLPLLVSSDNSIPPNPAAFPNGGILLPASTASLSSGGQFVAFSAGASNLPGPIQQAGEPIVGVFLRNTCLSAGPNCERGTTFVAYGPTSGPASNGGAACGSGQFSEPGSAYPAIDTSGEFVAFTSNVCQFWTGTTPPNANQLFLRDVILGTTSLISQDSTQNPVNAGVTGAFSMSTNPLSLAFAYETVSTNVLAGVTYPTTVASNCVFQSSPVSPCEIYWTNTQSTQLVSQSSGTANVAANNTAEQPSISADGRYVAFASKATNLVAATIPATSEQIFLRDTCAGVSSGCTPSTTLISQGTTASASSTNPSVAVDGRFVVFVSNDKSLTSSTNTQIYLYDAQLQTTTLLSKSGSARGSGESSSPFISADGRLITFLSASGNLNSGNSATESPYEYDTCQINGVAVASCTPGLNVLSTSLDEGGPAPVDATDQFVSYDVTNTSSGYPLSQAYIGRTTVPASAIPTTTALTSSATGTVIYGQPVTLTVTVKETSSGAAVTGGTVTFLDGSVTLGTASLSASGVATLTTTNLLGGVQPITATFSAAGSYGSSSSAAVGLDVLTPFSIQVSPSTATVTINGTKTFTATDILYSNGSTVPISGAVTWSVTSTPSGVASVDPVTGIATGLMNGTATITASQNGVTGTAALTVGTAPPTITTATLASGETGVPYTATVAANGGITPYAWSATGLPPGLTINVSTGIITGTPTTSTGSPYLTKVTVTDSNSATASDTYTLTIAPPPAATATPATLSFGIQLDSFPLTAVSGTAQSVTLKNTSTASVLTGITPTITPGANTNASDFSVTPTGTTCGATLPAGASCIINVVFAPSVAGGGAESATLSIADNASSPEPQTVSLSGTAVPFTLTSLSTSGSVTAGTTYTGTATITLAPGTGTLLLTCSGLSGTTCQFSDPAFPTLAPTLSIPQTNAVQTVTVSFSITTASGVFPERRKDLPPSGLPSWVPLSLIVAILLLGLQMNLAATPQHRPRTAWAFLALLVLCGGWLAACSSNSSGSSGPTSTSETFVITAKLGNLTQTINIVLQVNQ